MRQSDYYPLPDYAITLWHRGDGVMLQLPDGRSLLLPLSKLETDAPGWKFLMSVLAERRSNYQRERPNLIGTAGSPTAAQLEEALRAHRKKQERDKEITDDIFTPATEGA
jgi:hypothetical protein